MLILQRDGCKTVVDPTERRILQHLRRLKFSGRSRFLVLSTMEGDWLQVGGGSLCCLVEWYCAELQALWRAHRVQPLWAYRTATSFTVSRRRQSIQADEILRMAEAEEIVLAFSAGRDVTELFSWRVVGYGEEAKRAIGFESGEEL